MQEPSRFSLHAFALAVEITDIVGGVAVARVRECGCELRVGRRTIGGIAPCPIVPPFRLLITNPRPGVSIGSAKTTESQAFKKELALRRPDIHRIHPVADMHIAQVQSAGFAVISLADDGFMRAPELQVGGNRRARPAPRRSRLPPIRAKFI
jgi:hypothetical protein